MALIERDFIINSASVASVVWAFIKSNAKACIEDGRPLRLHITNSKKRTPLQNSMMHAVIGEIADKAWWNGRQYSAEFWKEYFRRRYLQKDEYTLPTGEIMQTYWSTADTEFTTAMCAEFVTKMQAEASLEWGICFDA